MAARGAPVACATFALTPCSGDLLDVAAVRRGAGATLAHAMREYAVVLEREEDGGYSIYVPDLPGCASQGNNKREALEHIREAIACYLEALETSVIH